MNRLIRRLVEIAVRNRVICRNLSVTGGRTIPWYLSPDAQLKYAKSTFDNELKEFVENHISVEEKVWDVGANCGTFSSFCLSKGVKHTILLVEPDIFLMSILLQNAMAFHINPICAAISDSIDIVELNVAGRGRASNSISTAVGRSEQGSVRFSHAVPTLTLDFLVKKYGLPDFVKIDIEGAELLAMNGATELINSRKTRFLIEANQENIEKIRDLFLKKRYRIEEVFPDNFFFLPE